MNYIILDLEWNRPLSPQRMIRDPFNLGGEIIQFGAVKIDSLDDLNITDAMWKFDIRPERSHDALNDAINTVAVMRKPDFSEGLEGYEI